MTETFLMVQEKFKRGVYRELELLTEEELHQEIFEIELWQERDLWRECQKYMDVSLKKEFRNYRKLYPSMAQGLFYLHHHFLDGNAIFTYSLHQCSKRWAIQYLKEKGDSFDIPIDLEIKFLSFLCELSDDCHEHLIPIYKLEYYFTILEMTKKIRRQGSKVYLTKKGYLEGQRFL